ncbi:MAG: LysR family transcriptional regulator [Dactylosporangium sp.]|nr:LysR family transcriptional regulator [Dactylosporangium sp.]NNJ60308.1 LysR family transcriptional regulator [Dactylosporangium sp.]
MDLRQLECVIAVAEELSFTRAARRLHTVQSGVSAAVAALERELGVRLFERTRQHVDLSDAGAALLPRAREVLSAVQAARDAVDEARGGLRGTVDLGTMISVGIVDLPALLGRFHMDHPAVTVRLRTMTTGTAGLVRALTDGTLDLAFVSLSGRGPGWAAGLAVRDLATWPMVLVCRADHRLAGERRVDLTRLAAESFIDFPVGYGNRTVADEAFAAAGIDRRVALEVSDIAAAAGFVKHGLGLAILPAFVAPEDDALRVLTIAGHPMTWKLSVATSRQRRPSAAARALLDRIESTWRDPGEPPAPGGSP